VTALIEKRWRPWIAAFLAFVYPGLGHLYLRAWFRMLVWFGLAVLTAALVIPQTAVSAFQTGGVAALAAATQGLTFTTLLPLFVVRVLNVVDAYLTGTRQNDRTAVQEGEQCPACGRPLDGDLDFCPWCTTRLDEPFDDSGATSWR